MEIEIENKIKEQMQKYKPSNMEEYEKNFELYKAEAGWEEWMNEYTEAPEGEECTEKEIKEITKKQFELWEEVHGDISDYENE